MAFQLAISVGAHSAFSQELVALTPREVEAPAAPATPTKPLARVEEDPCVPSRPVQTPRPLLKPHETRERNQREPSSNSTAQHPSKGRRQRPLCSSYSLCTGHRASFPSKHVASLHAPGRTRPLATRPMSRATCWPTHAQNPRTRPICSQSTPHTRPAFLPPMPKNPLTGVRSSAAGWRELCSWPFHRHVSAAAPSTLCALSYSGPPLTLRCSIATPQVRKLRTGYNQNFFAARSTGNYPGKLGSGPQAVPPRKIRTAPTVGAAYKQARLNQIKELTGYQVRASRHPVRFSGGRASFRLPPSLASDSIRSQTVYRRPLASGSTSVLKRLSVSVLQENFGPNIASFVIEEHVSMHTSKGSAARIASGLAKPAETAMTQAHAFDSLVFEERPVLARSWLYQPSGALPLPG